MAFSIDNVRDIEWSSHLFNTLVLPTDMKEMLFGLVDGHAKNENFSSAVIEGRGKGIVVLLSGPSGVGKTLTVQSIAETMQVPLYSMGIGDIRPMSGTVHRTLPTILDNVAKWNGILLLNRCDILLTLRAEFDKWKDEFISLFLRILDYYPGVVFITANSVKNMDPDFQSRIHVSIAYPELTAASRRRIWANCFRNLEYKSEISDGDLDSLAEAKIDGKQIENISKMSFLMASSKGVPLKKEFVDAALKAEEKRPEMWA